ncbi:MAG TPA: hypothetical protein VL486_10960 [Verrucomicrobiae bacterium]|nr:hypothetical protein [Verrucomicrobiae bacterium]
MMTTASFKKQRQQILRQIHDIREEIEDLLDSLDLLEARAQDAGKPSYSLAEVKKKLRLK